MPAQTRPRHRIAPTGLEGWLSQTTAGQTSLATQRRVS
jgi:hypothetical protein